MLDSRQNMEVGQSVDYGEEDNGFDGRVGGMDDKGLEYGAHDEEFALHALDSKFQVVFNA